MPTRPPVFRPSYADPKAAMRAYDKARGSPPERGYDHRWRKFRLWFLASNPLCVDCRDAGRVTAARDVHHVAKVRDHPEMRLDPANCRALCIACHSLRTSRGE